MSRNATFDLETYGPYLNKIRKLFVPSLEYRIHSLLEEFVYSGNSRWAMQFPYFKKFIDAIVTWRDPLIKAAEYDIGTMKKAIRTTIKRIVKDDLISCLLNSITLHYRLNKICRELDALGIEDNILRSLNVWNFVNEEKYHRTDRDCFTNPNIAADCNANSSDLTMSSCDAKQLSRCKKAIKLMTYHAYREESIEQPTSVCRSTTCRQIVDTNQDFHRWQTGDDSIRNEVISQNDDKVESDNEESRDAKTAKIRSFDKRLKMIVRKMYPEDCSCPAFSGSIVTCLALPCKPNDLIGRIFQADPSLAESCFIVMKRKFLSSVHNVCSCLNDILGKLDIEFAKTLYLNCEIYPGYIRFRLKSGNINKCLFVARISICQNVCRRTIQWNPAISTCKSKLNKDAKEESKCSEQCNDDDNDMLARVDEESKELIDICCSRSDPNIKNTTMDTSRDEIGNKETITCTFTDCVSKHLQDLTTFSCNQSHENIAEEICDVTSHVDDLKERNKKNSIEIDRENEEKRRRKIFDSDNSITMTNDEFTRLIDDASCMCLSENLVETNYENIFNYKDPEDDFSQYNRTRSPDKESNLEDEDCNANTCSIVSFVQNSERDKQLVELNCNRFLNNDIRAIDKQMEDDDSLNSVKAEIGPDSCCSSSRCDDFVDITVIDNISVAARDFEASRDDLDATKSANHCKSMNTSFENNDSLTVSVQTPRLRVSSKGINVNVNYPRDVVWLASDGSISTKTREDRRIEVMDPSALIILRKEHETLHNERASDKTQGFIKSSKKSLSRSGFRSKSSDISTEEYLRATSNTSRCCCSTNKFTASEFEKSYKSRRLSKLSSSDFRSVTSFTAIKYGTASRKDNDYSAKVRPQAILVMTKFRDSVDRSVGRIKRLVQAKLRKILFNDGIKASRTFWKNEESSEDTTREKTNERQGYSITSCSTCNCCRHSCALSSRESSNMILSIRRNRCREESKGGKFRDRRLTGGSEILSTFRSIETSYALLTPTVEEEHELSRKDRCNKRKKIKHIIRNRNSCDFENYGTSITISSQSAKVSGNDSKYLERYTCKQREETRDDKREIYKGICNRDRWKEARHGCPRRQRTHREVPIKYSSNESLETSSSYIQREKVKNMYKQSGRSRAKNTRGFAVSNKNQQKDADGSDDDRLCKRRVFRILTDICNDYTDDLDLDFKLHLLRYVELVKSVKRALKKTLRSNNFYEIDTMSNVR